MGGRCGFSGVSFLANVKVALKNAALLVEKRLDKDCRDQDSLQAFLPHTLFPRPGCCCWAGGFPRAQAVLSSPSLPSHRAA